MAFWLFASASALYGGAAAFSLISLRRGGAGEGAPFVAILVSGLALHTLAMGILWAGASRAPFANAYELMEAVSWATALVALAAAALARIRVAPSLASGVACVLAALPLFCPAFMAGMGRPDGISVDYAVSHAFLAVLSYAFLGFSFVFSVMYVLQLRFLKRKEGGALARSLMPLPRLVSFARWSLGLACAAMALSLSLGLAAAPGVSMDAVHAVKFACGALLFLLMLGLLVFAARRAPEPLVFARLCALLFLFAIVLIVPISIRSFI